jgi:hypothetical protein
MSTVLSVARHYRSDVRKPPGWLRRRVLIWESGIQRPPPHAVPERCLEGGYERIILVDARDDDVVTLDMQARI